jgi:predicted small secreted protein
MKTFTQSTSFTALSRVLIMLFALGSFGLLAACDNNDSAADKAAEQMDDMMDDAGDAVEDAGDSMEDAADEAEDSMQ